ncbi:metallophosphoesterase family protein [Paraburkholderia sp. BCC1885]|uniref:metallophosphoesterase family protein n=1 Tax=Paraburkholderia sp. BCC1885 TaxID=2562669 RepID=UPI001182BB7F|nr:metallophosphoesterase [Paraburkholderia sp. BCC1885]
MSGHVLVSGRGAGNRQSASTPAPATFTSHAAGSPLAVQSAQWVDPHFPFQPLPTPNGSPPYRFDLAQLLHADEVARIAASGKIAFHTVGDTGDERGKQMDFVAAMMTEDYENSAAGAVPAFFYHLGDVVYFAGDIGGYGENFYETYAEYPGLIVAIAGNHDCQPDDPQDGQVDPDKKPLDGWVQNFMSTNPAQLGSLKTTSSRTQMDLPNVYWTFTTPLVTIIGLFTNVSETQAEVHQDQLDWFKGELAAADENKALIVAIHHPPYSGDSEHSGSAEAEKLLFQSFEAKKRYPHLILSGHVHNYQRFTVKSNDSDITCVVAGAGGYSKLGKLQKIDGRYPVAPLPLSGTLTLDQYDHDNFGFLRIEVTKEQITGTYLSAPYEETRTATPQTLDNFVINLVTRKVSTVKV